MKNDNGRYMEEDRISQDFTWKELVYSETAVKHCIPNTPGKKEKQAIKELVKRLLQPLRIAYGKPIRISSGYRSPELNRLVGGVPSSQHVKGEAVDCVTDDPEELLHVLLKNNFPFDQAILYRKRGFLHLSLKTNCTNRMQVIPEE